MAKKKIGLQIDRELHSKIKSVAPLRGKNLEHAYDEALRQWLGENPTQASLLPVGIRHRELLEKLIYVLDSASADAIEAVTSNILLFHRIVKIDEGKGSREKATGKD